MFDSSTIFQFVNDFSKFNRIMAGAKQAKRRLMRSCSPTKSTRMRKAGTPTMAPVERAITPPGWAGNTPLCAAPQEGTGAIPDFSELAPNFLEDFSQPAQPAQPLRSMAPPAQKIISTTTTYAGVPKTIGATMHPSHLGQNFHQSAYLNNFNIDLPYGGQNFNGQSLRETTPALVPSPAALMATTPAMPIPVNPQSRSAPQPPTRFNIDVPLSQPKVAPKKAAPKRRFVLSQAGKDMQKKAADDVLRRMKEDKVAAEERKKENEENARRAEKAKAEQDRQRLQNERRELEQAYFFLRSSNNFH